MTSPVRRNPVIGSPLPSDLPGSAINNVRLWTWKGIVAGFVYALLDIAAAIRESNPS